MMKRACALLVLFLAVAAHADSLVASRATAMRDAIDLINSAAAINGYQLLKVQPIDEALVKRGYENPHVRIVFIGKPSVQDQVIMIDPRLLSVLPLRLTLIEENAEIRVISDDLEIWKEMFPDPETVDLIAAWQQDLRMILSDFSGF